MGHATPKVSAMRLGSMNDTQHASTHVEHQENATSQQKAYSDMDMPTHLEKLFEGATKMCNDESQKSKIREI